MTCCADRMVGVELRGIFDGVAYWWCPICDRRVHRFGPDDPIGQRVRAWSLMSEVPGGFGNIEEPAA